MLEQFINDLFKDLISGSHTEGIIFYIVGSVVLLYVHLRYGQEFRNGLKGENKLFESPEISLYLFFWYSPFIIMYGAFLQVKIDIYIWYFMAGNLAFALLGRYGLERILSARFGGSSSSSTETTKEVTVKKESST